MHIDLCDACGERIRDRNDRVAVCRGPRFSEFEFCSKCAQPVLKFIEEHLAKTKDRA